MYDYFYNPQYDLYDRIPLTPTYIRLLHASPNAPAVDVYANGKLIARNLSYRQFTEYTPIPGGSYNIIIYIAGQTANPVLNTNVNIKEGTIYTISAIGLAPNLSLLPAEEPRMNVDPDKLMLRFIHVAPNAPNVDVVIEPGLVAFSNVAYEGITQYIPLNPGRYTFSLNVTGTGQRVLYVPNIRLQAGRFYTIYAIGIAGGTPPLQVLVPLDGNTYIR